MGNKSYFSEDDIEQMVSKLKDNPKSPEWLHLALQKFPELSELLFPEEDEKRFVVEYIYPH